MSFFNKTDAQSKLTTPITGTGDDNLGPNVGQPVHAGNLQAYFTSFINWMFPSTIPADLSGMSPIITDYGDTSLSPNTNYANIKYVMIVPRGTISMYVVAGTNTSASGVYSSNVEGYLYCDGSVINLTVVGNEKYKKLRQLIGNNYGNTSTNPNLLVLPNFKGNVPMGYDVDASSTPSSAPLPTTNNNGAVGNVGGLSTVPLQITEMPQHNHLFTGNTTSPSGTHHHIQYGEYWGNAQTQGASPNGQNFTYRNDVYQPFSFHNPWTGESGDHTHTISGTIGNNGSGLAHENRMAYLVVNYIIKY